MINTCTTCGINFEWHSFRVAFKCKECRYKIILERGELADKLLAEKRIKKRKPKTASKPKIDTPIVPNPLLNWLEDEKESTEPTV